MGRRVANQRQKVDEGRGILKRNSSPPAEAKQEPVDSGSEEEYQYGGKMAPKQQP